jgi:hypothetical protein
MYHICACLQPFKDLLSRQRVLGHAHDSVLCLVIPTRSLLNLTFAVASHTNVCLKRLTFCDLSCDFSRQAKSHIYRARWKRTSFQRLNQPITCNRAYRLSIIEAYWIAACMCFASKQPSWCRFPQEAVAEKLVTPEWIVDFQGLLQF